MGAAKYGTASGGDRTLLAAFYRRLNDLFADDDEIPIPLPRNVKPQFDREKQSFLFADCAIRTLFPIGLAHFGLLDMAATLRDLPKIADRATLRQALRTLFDTATRYENREALELVADSSDLGFFVRELVDLDVDDTVAYMMYADQTEFAEYTASIATFTANIAPDATWTAVNILLENIGGGPPKPKKDPRARFKNLQYVEPGDDERTAELLEVPLSRRFQRLEYVEQGDDERAAQMLEIPLSRRFQRLEHVDAGDPAESRPLPLSKRFRTMRAARENRR